MAGNSTIYDVSIRYGLDDRASQALERLGATAEKTEKSVGGLKEGLRTIAEVFLAREAFHKGKELFVDINSEFEQMKIRMGGIIGAGLHISFDKASDSANRLVESWKQFSKTTTLTTKEITDFGAGISVGVVGSGGNVKQLDEMVKKGSQVMQILGAAHPGGMSYAITELNEALMGNVSNRQQSNVALLSPVLAKHGKELADFRKMNGDERRAIIMEAFNDPAWQGAIDKMKNSWKGVTSTLKDNIELTAAGIGDKLFSGLKVYVKGINEWIETHPRQIEEFGQKFSEYLVKGFEVVKSVFSFIVEHKDLLIKLAEAWAVSKVWGASGGFGVGGGGLLGLLGGSRAMSPTGEGMIGGLAGFRSNLGAFGNGTAAGAQLGAFYNGGLSPVDILRGVMVGSMVSKFGASVGDAYPKMQKFNEGMSMAVGGLSALPGPLGAVAGAAGVLLIGLNALIAWLDSRQTETLANKADTASILAIQDKAGALDALQKSMKYADDTQNGRLIREQRENTWGKFGGALVGAKELGAFGSGPAQWAGFDYSKFSDAMRRKGASGDEAARTGKILRDAIILLGDEVVRQRLHLDAKPTEDVTNAKKADKPNVNIHIHKIEVPATDPDRFVHQLVRKFEYVVRNPSQADSALRGAY